MSHILDALQKVQEEKTAKLKQSAITAGILLDAGAPRGQQTKRYLLAGIAAATLLIGVVAFWFFQRPHQQAQPKTAQAELPQVAQQQPATLPAPPPPVAAPQPTLTTTAAPPVVQPAAPAAPAQSTVPEEEEERPVRRSKRASAPASVTPTSSAPATPVTVGTPEGVKLSGIAWHDNRKLRRAVINDLLVAEGAEVAGARIVEIRTGLVKIEKNGTLFEVVLPH